MEPCIYYLFRDGLFMGKYTRSEWSKLTAESIFKCHVYRTSNGHWYYSAWGSLIPLNNCDIPKEIQALLLLTPIENL